MTEFCENCGHRRANTSPVTRGQWVLFPRESRYAGENVPITAQQSALLFELAKVDRAVCAEILGGWLSPESVDPTMLARVLVSHIRTRLGDLSPIATRPGAGYVWRDG